MTNKETRRLIKEAERLERIREAAPALLEALRNMTVYVQRDLIPSVREVVGGQALLDKGWTLVGTSHTLIAGLEETP